jgi:hypothetical protein
MTCHFFVVGKPDPQGWVTLWAIVEDTREEAEAALRLGPSGMSDDEVIKAHCTWPDAVASALNIPLDQKGFRKSVSWPLSEASASAIPW